MLLDTQWRVLCELVGREDVADLDLLGRLERRAEVDQILADWCSTRTVDEVVSIFADLSLPACKVNTCADAARDSHIQSRDMLQTVDIDGQQIPLTAPAANFSRTPVRIRTRAPGLGQHNAEILEELGYDNQAIDRLVAEGVVGALPES